MRAGVVVSGVLGLGTVLVFAAAALVSAMFPNGATVAAGWNGGVVWGKGGGFVNAIAVPAPPPMVVGVEEISGEA
ncbi:MAG: hypothetical protein Q8M74_04450, partial [Chloroflexota bacterium]|nr:hypothetical protein [Chloroflexota bacterium]